VERLREYLGGYSSYELRLRAISKLINAAIAAKSLESSKELLMERDELKQQLAVAQAALKEIAGPDQGSVIAKPATGGDAWTEKTVKEMCQFTASDFKLIADAHNAAVAYERQLRPAWDKINQLKDEIKELKGNKMTEGDCQIVIGALDSLGVALTDKKHQWTEGERAIYEKAIEIVLGIGRREPPTQAFTVEINGEDVLFVRLDAHNAALAAERDNADKAAARAELAQIKLAAAEEEVTRLAWNAKTKEEAIAEATKPLMDALKKIQSWAKDSGAVCNGDLRLVTGNALEKVGNLREGR
jgi:hypothetical protein